MSTKEENMERGEHHRIGVLLEQVDSKIDLVMDGQEALAKELHDDHEELGEFRGIVEHQFEVVLDELRLIHNNLTEKISRDEFALVEKRLIQVEKQVARLRR